MSVPTKPWPEPHKWWCWNKLFLADSLGNAGDLTEGEVYYWQVFAYYLQKQRRIVEFYWKESVMAEAEATDYRELACYAKSASYLTSATATTLSS